MTASLFLLLAAVLWSAAAVASLRASTPKPVMAPVSLRDDDGGAAMFSEANLAPGATRERCIALTVDAGAPAAITLAASGSGPATPFLWVDIDAGRGGSTASCSGFRGQRIFSGTLAELLDRHPWGQGMATWTAQHDGETATYRVSTRLMDVPAAQGLSGRASFAWHGTTVAVPPPAAGPLPAPPSIPAPPVAPPSTDLDLPSDPRIAPNPGRSSEPDSRAPADGVAPQAAGGGDPTAQAPPAVAGSAVPGLTHSAGAGRSPSEAPRRADSDPAQPRETATGTPASPSSTGESKAGASRGGVLGSLEALLADAARAAAPVVERAAFPALLALLILFFLVFQNVLDRRDPKLARSPLRRAAMLSFPAAPAEGGNR